ncbi:MAG TPA: response regulator [Bacteroidia bacterium]|jgi:two-component system OmpR family response regulator|nr:response regulator [Bacteroidia bacterium]
MNKKEAISVYLVDDDRMFLSSLRNTLTSEFESELEISTFNNGEECLKNVNGKPDIVILDYYLNDGDHPDAMDGLKVLRELKKKGSKDLMVIMLSGQDKLQVALDSIKNGAYEYVAKSESTFVRLENIIKNAIKSLKSNRENKLYEKWNIIMGTVIIAILLADVIYYYLGRT